MSNLVEKKELTQELIKETAMKLFFVEGKFDATTQEIADAAGVNRTLINYYFRSRDNLMNIVFEEAKEAEKSKSVIIDNSKLPFREKVERYIENSLNASLKYPYLETYIVMQMNRGCCENEIPVDDEVLKRFCKDLEEEMVKGRVDRMDPIQFVINLASLLMFPSAVRPLLTEKLKISNQDFDQIISDRKSIIMNILFKN